MEIIEELNPPAAAPYCGAIRLQISADGFDVIQYRHFRKR